MRKIWVIATRELRSFFDSLVAYIMLILFLGFSGFFTWIYGSDIFFINQATLQGFFGIAYWSLFFFIPALTMRSFAEENRAGTIELLQTRPITDWQIVVGKFLATLFLICIALVLTLPYYITISTLGSIDHGGVWSGYLGLILMSGVYISIGLFASSISSNQIVGFLLGLLIGIFFHIIFEVLATNLPGVIGNIFSYLSMSQHYESISRGVVDTKDLIYFFSLMLIGLISTELVLSKRSLAD